MRVILNQRYVELLIKNAAYQRELRGEINSQEYKDLQKDLLAIELKMSAQDIIKHHEHTFPTVGMPID